MTRKNSLRGRVIRRWEKAGKPNWSLEKTISICKKVEGELREAGFNRTPKFSRSIREKNQQYIRNWVQGCHFGWINPRRISCTGGRSVKMGIDLDDCITYCPLFFKAMTNAMRNVAEIHIITNREQTPENEAGIRKELDELGIRYHRLVVTDKKADYILKNGITVFFDDTDEYFLNLPESVTVFKIREPWNFDFENHKWLYKNKTGKLNTTTDSARGNQPTKAQQLLKAQKRDLKTLLTKGLTRTERLIIVFYYYDKMTIKEIAKTLDLSESRVSQMHSSIVARLKAQMNTRKKGFAIVAETKKQWPREQHYLFAHETMKDLFFKEPQCVIDKLKDDNWKEYLLKIWDKAGKNSEKSCLLAPDGLSREIRIRADNTVIALITLPKPQVFSEAYFIALLCRPCEENFSSKQKVIPRYLLLEYSVPRGYGNLNNVLKEWTEKGWHNIGYGCEPTLEAFYEAVCDLL